MIYTITLNPAIDLVIITKKLESNTVNRTENFELQPNGKGVNVSFILKKMGIKNMATGIGGGFTLDYITAGLEEKGIKTKFLKVKEPTRINVFTRVLDQNVEYKEVNPGPEVGQDVQDKFLKYLKDTLKADDTLIISGSFSRGIKAEYLVEIAKITAEKKVKLVIDSSSKVVLDTLEYQPYLLKPNDQELASFFDLNEKLDQKKIIELARKLISAGCQNVLVSLGENGAALINKDHAYFGNAPKIQALNTAGAGDTMLGTFIGEKEKDKSDTAALKSAIVAGSDTASRSGLTDFKLEKYLNEIQVSEIK
ncbi:1-phosphofructokinase [Lactobacillus paragasseri]|uniref:1-phosphofructokinase n=1 Tax=Lactobacillus paragasseri TaxID=2107999 RepID=UPI00254F1C3E|nr:1-phosphofructokinase [Lactobacillus paragasseri]MDK7136783.1 1-phosphofructokinase [Lactobacillus paragasseri]